MGALFSLRDNDLPRFSGQLDTLAADLVERFSQDGLDPTTAADDPGLFWDPQGPDTTGLAGRVALNPLVDPDENGDIRRVRDGLGSTTPGPPGDNTVIKGLLDAMTEIRPINSDGVQGFFSSAELAAHLSSLTAQFRLSHETSLSSIQTQLTAVTDAIQQSTGVDLDQQMQTLLLVEQAYSANARVIEIADQMLNRLLEI